jgi:biopolymer transport protein ExbD
MLAFREFEERFNKKKSADFTPLIDVIFNLLLFYLLTSSVMVSSFLVALPSAGNVSEAAASHTLVLTRDGGLLWDNRAVSLQDLPQALRRAAAKRLTLEADEGAPFGKVTELMDLARAAGFEEISFTVLEKTP